MTAEKFDRSAFKPTTVSDMREQEEEVKAKLPSKTTRSEIVEPSKEGNNELRIFPKHPGSKRWICPLVVTFLKVGATDDNGNPEKDDSGKQKIVSKPIFDAVIHGQWDEGMIPQDIIRVYKDMVWKQANAEVPDKEKRKLYMLPVQGSPYNPNHKGAPEYSGLKQQESHIVYGKLNNTFNRVKLKTTIKNRLNEISASRDKSNGAIVVDPFTHPDTGRSVLINYIKDKQNWTTEIDFDPTPLTDSDLEELMTQKPLEELYTNCYRLKDFQLAMEGLKRFDEESGEVLRKLGFNAPYGIVATDAFLDIAEELFEYWKKKEDDRPVEQSNTATQVQTTPEPMRQPSNPPFEATSQSTDSSDKLSSLSMDGLKAYIKSNNLMIRVLPSYNEDKVRQLIREDEELSQQQDSDFAANAEGLDVAAELAKPVEESVAPTTDAKADRLAKFAKK